LFFEVLDEVVQLTLVDRVNANLCLHLLCLHSLREVFSLGILSEKKSHTCLLTAMDLPPPCTRLLLILARSMTENQGSKNGGGAAVKRGALRRRSRGGGHAKRTKRTPPVPHETTRYWLGLPK